MDTVILNTHCYYRLVANWRIIILDNALLLSFLEHYLLRSTVSFLRLEVSADSEVLSPKVRLNWQHVNLDGHPTQSHRDSDS